jgi:hypothetical protein
MIARVHIFSPGSLPPRQRCNPSKRGTALLAMAALCVAATGCQTFSYTKEDLARERKRMADEYGSGAGLSGMGSSMGGFRPNIGNIRCPGLGGAGLCPGK